MSSLTNQQANTKSMTGLSDTYSTNIVCDTFECSDEFTIDPGCVITLPANSIPDSALSTNVAFRNQNNTFSLTNIFSSIVQFTSTTIPIITQSIPANDATTKIPTTSWTDTYFGKLTLASPTTTQTWFGQNRFSNSGANLAVLLRNIDQPTYNGGLFIPSASGQFNANNTLGDTCLISLGTNASNTGALSLTTWSSTNCGIRITLNDVRINGTTSTINSACSFTNTTTPVITQAIPANDATTKIPTTSWTDTYFGKKTLATGSTVQTWFGNNKFTSNAANLAISLDNTDAPTYDGGLFISSVAAQGNPITTVGNTVLIANGTGIDTGILSLCVNSSTSCGIRMSSSSMSIIGGTTLTMSGTTCNNTATNYNVSSITSFSNVTTPVITQAISLADNSTKISTTAFVKGQNYITSSALTPYALLAGTQTFSGVNTFTGVSNINNTVFYNNQTDARFVAITGEATQMYQTAGGFTIASITNGKFIALNTRDATGTIIVDGVVCKNGNQAYLQSNANTVNRIDITGNQATIGGTLVPIMTTQPLTASNNNEIASTAFVKNQNYITASALTPYALLAPTSLQTFAGTAENTFNNRVNINDDLRFFDTFASKISQSGNALIIENISNVNSVQIRSTTAGLVQRTGLLIENGITCTLQGGSGNTITITGVTTPTLGIPPLASTYTSEIATTSWVNTELTGKYARLNVAQTFTAQNTFTTATPTAPIVIKNTVSSNSGGLLITDNLNYNNINNTGDFAVIGFGPTIDNGVLNLTTWANGSCGIKIDNDTITQNAPFTCGYLQLGAPITSKTNFNIGYQWDIGGGAFTGTSWATAVGAYNIMTIAWDGTGDKTLGVWLCELVIITNCSTAPAFSLCWNTISNTSMDISEKCTQSNLTTVFNAASHQITRLNFTLNITNFLGNYFLNSSKVGGAGLSSNTSFSQIKFTRIA